MTDADREYFVALMAIRSEERAVRIAAYGLMSNHFHLVAVGDQADAVSLFMMDLNGLYATYPHVTHRHTGASGRADSIRPCWTRRIGLPRCGTPNGIPSGPGWWRGRKIGRGPRRAPIWAWRHPPHRPASARPPPPPCPRHPVSQVTGDGMALTSED